MFLRLAIIGTRLALLLVSVLPSLYAQQNATRPLERAISVRNVDDLLYNVNNAREVFFAFCRDLHGAVDPGMEDLHREPVTRMFLNASAFLIPHGDNCSLLRRFISEAHARNIAVELLDGDRTWIEAGGAQAARVMGDLLSFNREGSPTERFDGFMFDVRPEGWAMAYTTDTRPQVLSLLKVLRSSINSGNDRIRLGVELPRWYYPRLGRDAMAEIMGVVNDVLVDDYVHQESVLIQSLEHEIVLANELGVSISAGINAAPNMNPSMTYQEDGWLALEQGVTKVYATFVGDKSFTGVVINDYQSYRDLHRSRHTLASVSWSFQVGRPFAQMISDTASMVILDPFTAQDTAKIPKRKEMDLLHVNGSRKHDVLMTVPINAILTFDATSRKIVCASHADIIKRYGKVVDAGFDGILVDCCCADSLRNLVGVTDLSLELVAALDSLGFAMRQMHSRPAAVIILRNAIELLPRMNASHFGRLSAIVDGVMVNIPGPLFMRERDTVFTRLYETL